MDTIKVLREKLQKEKLENRERPWGYRLFQRGLSVYLTWLLIRTPLTPNMLSVFSIFSGVYGACLLLSPLWHIKLIALFFFYLHLVLDRVDGEIARYKKIFSLKGIYLDELNHLVIPPLFFLTLANGLKDSTAFSELFVIAAGTLAAFASVFLRVTHNLPYGIFLKKYWKHQDILPLPLNPPGIAELRTAHALLYPFFTIFHQFQDFFITLVLFAATLIAEHFTAPNGFLFPYSTLLLILYALYLPLIVLENIIKGLRTIENRMREIQKSCQAE